MVDSDPSRLVEWVRGRANGIRSMRLTHAIHAGLLDEFVVNAQPAADRQLTTVTLYDALTVSIGRHHDAFVIQLCMVIIINLLRGRDEAPL